MYLVTYEPETGIITSAGVIDSAYALQPEELPEGSVYTEALPKGDLTGVALSGQRFCAPARHPGPSVGRR